MEGKAEARDAAEIGTASVEGQVVVETHAARRQDNGHFLPLGAFRHLDDVSLRLMVLTVEIALFVQVALLV